MSLICFFRRHRKKSIGLSSFFFFFSDVKVWAAKKARGLDHCESSFVVFQYASRSEMNARELSGHRKWISYWFQGRKAETEKSMKKASIGIDKKKKKSAPRFQLILSRPPPPSSPHRQKKKQLRALLLFVVAVRGVGRHIINEAGTAALLFPALVVRGPRRKWRLFLLAPRLGPRRRQQQHEQREQQRRRDRRRGLAGQARAARGAAQEEGRGGEPVVVVFVQQRRRRASSPGPPR